MARAPGPVGGNSKATHWFNRFRDFVVRTRIVESPGYQLNETVSGTFIQLDDAILNKGGSANVKQAVVTAADHEKLTCRDVNDTATTPETYEVAKPASLRTREITDDEDETTYTAETAGSTSIGSFLHLANGNRKRKITLADVGEFGIEEEIIPPYSPESAGADKTLPDQLSIIWIAKVPTPFGVNDSGTGIEDVEWIDLNIDKRDWKPIYSEVQVCIDRALSSRATHLADPI